MISLQRIPAENGSLHIDRVGANRVVERIHQHGHVIGSRWQVVVEVGLVAVRAGSAVRTRGRYQVVVGWAGGGQYAPHRVEVGVGSAIVHGNVSTFSDGELVPHVRQSDLIDQGARHHHHLHRQQHQRDVHG